MRIVKCKKRRDETLEDFLSRKGFRLHPSLSSKEAQLTLLKRFEETLKEKEDKPS